MNTDGPVQNYCNDQGSLAQRTLSTIPFTETFIPGGNGNPPEVAMMSQSLQQGKFIDVCCGMRDIDTDTLFCGQTTCGALPHRGRQHVSSR